METLTIPDGLMPFFLHHHFWLALNLFPFNWSNLKFKKNLWCIQVPPTHLSQTEYGLIGYTTMIDLFLLSQFDAQFELKKKLINLIIIN